MGFLQRMTRRSSLLRLKQPHRWEGKKEGKGVEEKKEKGGGMLWWSLHGLFYLDHLFWIVGEWEGREKESRGGGGGGGGGSRSAVVGPSSHVPLIITSSQCGKGGREGGAGGKGEGRCRATRSILYPL